MTNRIKIIIPIPMVCELMLTLGLKPNRKAYPAPENPNDAAYHAFTR